MARIDIGNLYIELQLYKSDVKLDILVNINFNLIFKITMETDKKILKYNQLARLHEKYQKLGKKVVFTSGCYDLIHFGHVMHFNFCKSQGDILVVSVGNDKTLRELKGPSRPLVQEDIRIRMIAALQIVNHVVLSEESGIMDHTKMVKLLKPDLYIDPVTDKYQAAKRKLVASYGGELLTCKRLPPQHLKGGISTTKLAEKLDNI